MTARGGMETEPAVSSALELARRSSVRWGKKGATPCEYRFGLTARFLEEEVATKRRRFACGASFDAGRQGAAPRTSWAAARRAATARDGDGRTRTGRRGTATEETASSTCADAPIARSALRCV